MPPSTSTSSAGNDLAFERFVHNHPHDRNNQPIAKLVDLPARSHRRDPSDDNPLGSARTLGQRNGGSDSATAASSSPSRSSSDTRANETRFAEATSTPFLNKSAVTNGLCPARARC